MQSWSPGAHSVQGLPQVFALSSHDLNGPDFADLLALPELPELPEPDATSLSVEEDFFLLLAEVSSSSGAPVPAPLGSSYSTGFNRGPQATRATVPATSSIRETNVRVTRRLLGGRGEVSAAPAMAFGYLERKPRCKGFVQASANNGPPSAK